MNFFEKNKGIRYIFKLENGEILELDYWLQPNSLREKWLNEIKSRLNKNNSYLNLKISNKNYLHLSELTKKLNSIVKDINDAYKCEILPSLDGTADICRKKLNELHEKFEEYGESRDEGDVPESLYLGEYVHRLWLNLNEWIHITETAMETGEEDFPNYSALVTVYPPYPGQILEDIDKLFLTTDYSWGQLYLGYNTLGKDYTHICFDNDIRVITNDQVKVQELYSSEAWLCFQQKSFFAKEFETQFYKWYETADQEVQELVPIENLNKLALGRYFIGHIILNEYLLKFHPIEKDWYTDIELQKRWNNEVFSKVEKVIKIELLDDLDAPEPDN